MALRARACAGLVGGVPEQAEGLLFVAERVGVTALVLGDPAEGVAGEGLAGAVAEMPAQPQACRQVAAGLPVVGQPDAGGGDGPAGRGLPGHVTQAGRGGQRGALGSGPFVPVPAAVQELGHRPGQYPGAGIAAGIGGQADTAEEDLVLCFEPGQCLLVAVEAPGNDARAGRGERRHRHAMGVEQQGGGMAGVQVVVEHALDGGLAPGFWFVPGGLLGGVGAQQIVQAVAARDMLGGQVGHGQRVQRCPRAVVPGAQQGGCRRDADVGAGVDAEQPEHLRGRLARGAGRTRRTPSARR